MLRFETLQSLRIHAFRYEDWMGCVLPNGTFKKTNVATIVKSFEGFYCSTKNVVAFCHKDNSGETSFYVIPRTMEVDTCLSKFMKVGCFQVPFSDGSEPAINTQEWYSLLEWARIQRQEEFSRMCKSYNLGNKIYELDRKIMRNSIEIPENGIWILHKNNTKSCFYPIVHQNDEDSYQYLGKFNEEGNVILFIKDGRTFLTKYSKKVINDLYREGYFPCDLAVPLSQEGDQFIDPSLQKKWMLIRQI